MVNKKGWDKYWGLGKTIKKVTNLDTAYSEVVNEILRLTNKKSKCIEIGCGSGTYAIHFVLNGRDCIASDLSEHALKIVRSKARNMGVNVSTKIVDMYKIPYRNNYFDLVFSDGVIEHENNLNLLHVLNEKKRVLKPNGWMVAKVPNDSLLYRLVSIAIEVMFHLGVSDWRPKENLRSREEWASIARSLGYKDIEIQKCGSLFIALIRRIFKSNKYDDSVPNIGKLYFLIKAKK